MTISSVSCTRELCDRSLWIDSKRNTLDLDGSFASRSWKLLSFMLCCMMSKK